MSNRYVYANREISLNESKRKVELTSRRVMGAADVGAGEVGGDDNLSTLL